MTAPDMESIIAAVLVAHWDFWTDTTQEPFVDRCGGCKEVVHTHGTQLKTALAAHQARAVLAAISEAGVVEWGVRWGDGHVATRKSKQSALNQIEYTAGSLVSRVTGPWTAVEG